MADLDEGVLRERRLQRGGEVCSAVSDVLGTSIRSASCSGRNSERTSESDFTSKHHQCFSELFLFLPKLLPLRLHASPWHHKAYALPSCIQRLAIRYLVCSLDGISLFAPSSTVSSCIVGLILQCEEEIVVVARVAQVTPHPEDRVGGKDLLVGRHAGRASTKVCHIARRCSYGVYVQGVMWLCRLRCGEMQWVRLQDPCW